MRNCGTTDELHGIWLDKLLWGVSVLCSLGFNFKNMVKLQDTVIFETATCKYANDSEGVR